MTERHEFDAIVIGTGQSGPSLGRVGMTEQQVRESARPALVGKMGHYYLPLAMRLAFCQAHSLRSASVFAFSVHISMNDLAGPAPAPVAQPLRPAPAAMSDSATTPILNCMLLSL